MSFFKRSHLMDPISGSFIHREYSFFKPSPLPCFSPLIDVVEDELGYALDLVSPSLIDLPVVSPLDFFESAADLVQIDRTAAHFRRLHDRAETELRLRSLSDRVAALELGFDRAMKPKPADQERKYKWTAEIKGGPKGEGFDRKYKLTAVKGVAKKNVKWTAEITGKGKDSPLTRTYTFQASTIPSEEAMKEKQKKGEKGNKEALSGRRVVEIEEEPVNPGAIVLKQAFAKRAIDRSKGKRKDLSPQDAALIIQMSFRAHLVRRSQVLRGLRDLAVAKAKLKEIRALFSNYSYRHRIEVDAEECQRFSEKIIVLLLTVDAIEGLDYIIRAAKRSMVVELEAMLEVVNPQPPGKLGSMKRRHFDLPTGVSISKELAMGVAEVVQMLDEEENHGNVL